jgi:membrane-bound lytic murein transglycosylase MltF
MNRNLLVALLALAVACGMPRDPRRTLEHVRGATLRVGVGDGSGAEGREGALIRGFAASLGAKVEWIRGPQEAQLDALHDGDLDLVAGRLTSDSPWKKKVALTKPLRERLTARLRELDWVGDCDVRLREEGNLITGEVFVVPRTVENITSRWSEVQRIARKLDWRFYDLAVVPVESLE